MHPHQAQPELLEFCNKHGIKLTAYSPSGYSQVANDPTIVQLAEKYKVSPSNILISLQANRPGVNGQCSCRISWELTRSRSSHPVIPKSVTPSRIEENAKIIDLAEEDIQELTAIEKNNHIRICKPFWTGWGAIGFPDLEGSEQ